jgi:PPOX class probable F420-dependent enzyme
VAHLTDEQAALFLADNYAVVTTLRADGSPHQTATWIDCDGERVVFNITVARKKYAELHRDPRASVFVFDGDDPYRWVTASGTAELTLEGAEEHIHKLSRKYRGRDYVLRPGEQRVIVRVTLEHVTAYGFDS